MTRFDVAAMNPGMTAMPVDLLEPCADQGIARIEIHRRRPEAFVGADDVPRIHENRGHALCTHVAHGQPAGETLPEAHDEVHGAGGAFPDQLHAVKDFLQLVAHDGQRREGRRLVGGAEEHAHSVEVLGADCLQGVLHPVGAFLRFSRKGDETVGDPFHRGQHDGHAVFPCGICDDAGHRPDPLAVGDRASPELQYFHGSYSPITLMITRLGRRPSNSA